MLGATTLNQRFLREHMPFGQPQVAQARSSVTISCEQLQPAKSDPEGSPGRWRVTLPDGTRFLWAGFYTGPITLGRAELEIISRDLLGLDLDDVPAAADLELRPYISDGTPVPSIVMHSATPVLKSVKADMNDALNHQPADDVATYVETRAVVLAGPVISWSGAPIPGGPRPSWPALRR